MNPFLVPKTLQEIPEFKRLQMGYKVRVYGKYRRGWVLRKCNKITLNG